MTKYSPQVTIERSRRSGEHKWNASYVLYEKRSTMFSGIDNDYGHWVPIADQHTGADSPEAALNRLKYLLGGRIPETKDECPLL